MDHQENFTKAMTNFLNTIHDSEDEGEKYIARQGIYKCFEHDKQINESSLDKIIDDYCEKVDGHKFIPNILADRLLIDAYAPK